MSTTTGTRRRTITLNRKGTIITDPVFETVLSSEEIAQRVDDLAERISPDLAQGDWTAVVILLGATPFASDLIRALGRRGIDVGFDALWLESYRDARESSGRVLVRADLSRPVRDRKVLLLDDVFDSGRTISFARAHLMAQGATDVKSCVFARKPDAVSEGLDHWAYEAPSRYLVGYGMDDAGKWRGLPYLGAISD